MGSVQKVNGLFIVNSFSEWNSLRKYSKAVFNIGLWESEKIFFTKYLHKDGYVLDIGCGAGRTTFGLYKMGYTNIIGVDLTPRMIENAKIIFNKLNIPINFEIGDACNLSFENNTFDGCLFSFNGIMQIPEKENRIVAMSEINRVLKKNCRFVFTTPDREKDNKRSTFWMEEKRRWLEGKQDKRIHEFGDRVTVETKRLSFLHVPDREEIIECIEKSNFKLLEDAWLLDIADDTEDVKAFRGNCRFWAVEKCR